MYLYTKKMIYQTKISLLHRGVTNFCLQNVEDAISYFKESRYLDTLLQQANSINSSKNCYECK